MGRRRCTRACGLRGRDQLRVLDSRMSRDDLYQKHCFEDKSFVYVEPEEEEVVSAMNRKQQLQPVWKSTSVSGAPDNSSLSHFSAMNAASPRHRAGTGIATPSSRRRRDDSARMRRKI